MNNLQKRRLYMVLLSGLGLLLALSLILFALRENINAFITPSEIDSLTLNVNAYYRLGGVVKEKSVKRDETSLKVHFIITDFKNEALVNYEGVLPDLFREGKGVIVEGSFMHDRSFMATQVLAKHDENYAPPSIKTRTR